VLAGFNDLETVMPSIAKEWNFDRNEGLTPRDVTAHSNKDVWWKCERGHNWQATVNHRSAGEGCPICSSELRTSFPEYALLYYLRNYGVDALHSPKELDYELDVFIPKLKIAIEYDGGYWHRNRINEDLAKNARCEKDGIKLYRIREGLSSLNSTSIDFVIKNTRGDLSDVIRRILNDIIKAEVDVDLQRDFLAIEQLRVYSEKANSLLSLNQALAAEWNYEKNGVLLPEHVTSNSSKKVWWKCSDDHEWQATIQSRNNGKGCPFCSGRVVISGVNDLQTLNPALAQEWNFEKNGDISPSSVKSNSGKKVWWKCAYGHEWQATVAKRNAGSGCPHCHNKKRKSDIKENNNGKD
jgi:very-short-patch-repair endonuclease